MLHHHLLDHTCFYFHRTLWERAKVLGPLGLSNHEHLEIIWIQDNTKYLQIQYSLVHESFPAIVQVIYSFYLDFWILILSIITLQYYTFIKSPLLGKIHFKIFMPLFFHFWSLALKLILLKVWLIKPIIAFFDSFSYYDRGHLYQGAHRRWRDYLKLICF
jgi:hypothetical protein